MMLLFELMNERVWREAVRNTSGLNAFFEGKRASYVWPQLITASRYSEDSTFLRKLSKASNNPINYLSCL